MFRISSSRRVVLLALLGGATCLLLSEPALACPNCKFAVETDSVQPQAYMVSILFMLGMVGSVFGGVGALLFWLSRHETAALETAGYQHLLHNAVSQGLVPAPVAHTTGAGGAIGG